MRKFNYAMGLVAWIIISITLTTPVLALSRTSPDSPERGFRFFDTCSAGEPNKQIKALYPDILKYKDDNGNYPEALTTAKVLLSYYYRYYVDRGIELTAEQRLELQWLTAVTALYLEYTGDNPDFADEVARIASITSSTLKNTLYLVNYVAIKSNNPLSVASAAIWKDGSLRSLGLLIPLEDIAAYQIVLLSEGFGIDTLLRVVNSVWKEFCEPTIIEHFDDERAYPDNITPFHNLLLSIENASSLYEAKRIINKAIHDNRLYLNEITTAEAEALASALYRNKEFRKGLVEEISAILYK